MGGSISTEELSIRRDSSIVTSLLERQSAEGIISNAKLLAEALAPHVEKDKNSFDYKTLLRSYVDPITGYGLYHTLCFGGYYYGSEIESIKIIKHLIADGVIDDVDIVDPRTKQNALHLACARGADDTNHNSMRNNRMKKKEETKEDSSSSAAETTKQQQQQQQEAVDTDIVVFLVCEGVNFSLQDAAGRTPLMHAARALNLVSIRELVGRGAAVNVVDNSGKNVFHHFVLAYGADYYHPELPVDEILDTLSCMIAVADSATKNRCVVAHRRVSLCQTIREARTHEPVSVEDFDAGTHLVTAATRDFGKVDEATKATFSRYGFTWTFANIHRVDPFALPTTPQPEEQYLLPPFLLLLREFSFNEADAQWREIDVQKVRVSMLNLFLKNNFSILPMTRDHNANNSVVSIEGFFQYINHSIDSNTVQRKARHHAEHKGSAFLAPGFVVSLVRDENGDTSKVDAKPCVDLSAATDVAFDPRLVASFAFCKEELAAKNPLMAAIVLGHFGLFRQILDVCGFSALLIPVGERRITPLHLLVAISSPDSKDKIDDNKKNNVEEYVNRLIAAAVAKAKTEKYFEGRSAETVFGSLKAVPVQSYKNSKKDHDENTNEENGISPLDLRPSLKNEFSL